MRNALIAVVCLTVVGAACGGTDDSESHTFDATPTIVRVTSGVGTVTVDGAAPGDGTVVTVERDGTGVDAEVTVDIDEDGVLTVQDDCGDDDGCRVGYLIEFGAGSDVEVTGSGGLVVIGDLTGAVTADTGGGDLTIASTSGPLQLASAGGRILGTGVIADQATVDTGGGGADITFDEPVTALDVSTDGGNLTVQLPGGPYAIDADTGGGSLSVLVDRADDAAHTAVLRSGGGNITVYRR